MEKWKSSASGGGEEPARKVSGCLLSAPLSQGCYGRMGGWRGLHLGSSFFFLSTDGARIFSISPFARCAVPLFAGIYAEIVGGLDGASEAGDGKRQQQQQEEEGRGEG